MVWLLEQYTALKEAARQEAASELFQKIKASGPFGVRAAPSNGWFDLQLDQNTFGALPENDQSLLAGQPTVPDDPLQDLAGGIIDVPSMRLVEEFTAALIQYTPPHFKNIYCKVTEGREARSADSFLRHSVPGIPRRRHH